MGEGVWRGECMESVSVVAAAVCRRWCGPPGLKRGGACRALCVTSLILMFSTGAFCRGAGGFVVQLRHRALAQGRGAQRRRRRVQARARHHNNLVIAEQARCAHSKRSGFRRDVVFPWGLPVFARVAAAGREPQQVKVCSCYWRRARRRSCPRFLSVRLLGQAVRIFFVGKQRSQTTVRI